MTKKGLRKVTLLPLVPVAWLWRSALVQVRRYRIRHELLTHTPEGHPALSRFADNELVPLKGISFRVRARYTHPAPCIILEPTGSTRNAKINRLRVLRREDRIERKIMGQVRRDVNRQWKGGTRVD